MERSRKGDDAEVAFELPGPDQAMPSLQITGVSEEILRSPEKIKQLMDLLELPEGTNARVTTRATTSIVR